MKRLHFNDYEYLACDIADKYDSLNAVDGYNEVSIIVKYEEARQIIKELLCIGYDIHSISMHDVEYDGYEFEYIISLYEDEIWVEPMMREDGYITDDSPVIYVLDNCSSKVIPYCKGKIVFEVSIDKEECEDSDKKYTCICYGCCDCEDDDLPCGLDVDDYSEMNDDMHGFTATKSDEHSWSSYSFHSTDKKLVEEMAKLFK